LFDAFLDRDYFAQLRRRNILNVYHMSMHFRSLAVFMSRLDNPKLSC
jgi:hypothetical protein